MALPRYDSDSYAAFIDTAQLATHVQQRFLPGSQICVFRCRGEEPLPTPAIPEVALHLTTAGRLRYSADFGFGKFEGVKTAGQFGLTPPGFRASIEGKGRYENLGIVLPWAQIEQMAADLGIGRPGDLGALHGGMQSCPMIAELVEKLWAEADKSGPVDAMLRESLVMSLVLRLLQMRERMPPNAPRVVAKGGLAPWQIKRVLEFIEDDLSRNLSIEQLAGLCSLSAFHFARAFASSIGQPPHAYVMTRRLEAAKRLLIDTNLSITEISLSIGYAEPSHFARVFRQAYQVAPAAFRRMR